MTQTVAANKTEVTTNDDVYKTITVTSAERREGGVNFIELSVKCWYRVPYWATWKTWFVKD